MAEIDKEKLRRAIVNRGMVVPVVEYDDGSQGWGVPGLIMEPIEAWQRLQAGASDNVARMQQGLPFDPQAAGDAFAVTGAAAMGSVAAPKPAGAYVTSGTPMKPTHLPMDEASRMARAKEMGFDTDATWYHGSKSDFGAFDASRLGVNSGELNAFSFSSAPSVADSYAGMSSYVKWDADFDAALKDAFARAHGQKQLRPGQTKADAVSEHKALVDQAYRNDPAVWNWVENYMDGANVRPVFIRAGKQMQVDANGDLWKSIGSEKTRIQDIVERAKKDGYDSVLVKNVRDAGSESRSGQVSDSLFVFDPRNIRSKYAAFDPAKADSADLLAANPKEAAALGAAVQGEKQGIRAYHGSPYDFDRFDISKMGSGEGAQAYGPGLYFAEAEDVARNYRDNLQPMASQARDNPDSLMRTAFSVGRDAAGALQYLESEWRKWGYDRPQNDLQTYRAAAMREAIERIKGGETAAKNRKTMYEVRINADPEDFLDWDAPWASQPAAVQRAMREAGVHPERSGPFGTKEIPDTPISISAGRALKDPQHMIHETLKEQSVPGIKYLDQGSRGAGEGSRNYVVFDDSLISIVKKYGIAGAASLYGVSELELMEAMQEQGL